MGTPFIEPRDGDVVVVGASISPDGQPPTPGPKRYAVIEWGLFQVVAERMGSLPKQEAIVEARHCASERGRDAWDSTGTQITKLPRLPLVYRGVGATYAVSLDVTDYRGGETGVAWKSLSYLSEAAALEAITGDGISMPLAKALLGKAAMPLACS
jgi:hypothetical protein